MSLSHARLTIASGSCFTRNLTSPRSPLQTFSHNRSSPALSVMAMLNQVVYDSPRPLSCPKRRSVVIPHPHLPSYANLPRPATRAPDCPPALYIKALLDPKPVFEFAVIPLAFLLLIPPRIGDNQSLHRLRSSTILRCFPRFGDGGF